MKTLLASVAAIGMMGGAALAQQMVIIPNPGAGSGQAGAESEQRFILVPAPRYAPGSDAARSADASTALELYRRGYQQGVSDARSAARPQFDPTAIERIGRELFERGYVLGMMQAQAQATAQETREALTSEQGEPSGQRQAGQPQTDRQVAQATESEERPIDSQVDEAEVPPARIQVQDSEEYGQYLVDMTGAPIYMFTADEQGTGDTQAVSNCHDDCAEAWPPVLTRSDAAEVEAVGPVQSDLVGTIEREDGATQVTYNGWPLYNFVRDRDADAPTGQDVHGHGGEWYLLTPAGEKVGED